MTSCLSLLRNPSGNVVYILKEVGGGSHDIVKCTIGALNIWQEEEVLLSDVVEFEMTKEYMFATKSVVHIIVIVIKYFI